MRTGDAVEAGVAHPERPGDASCERVLERRAAQALDQPTRDHEAHAAVVELAAGPGGRVGAAGDGPYATGEGAGGIALAHRRGQAGAVREELAHGDVGLGAVEAGEVFAHRIVEVHAPLVHEGHQRRRGQPLAGRRDGNDRPLIHAADRVAVDELVAPGDEQHPAAKTVVGHTRAQGRVGSGERRGRLHHRGPGDQHREQGGDRDGRETPHEGRLRRGRGDQTDVKRADSTSRVASTARDSTIRRCMT